MRNRIILVLMLALVLAPVMADAGPKVNVISIGDSWANGWSSEIEYVLQVKGHPVDLWNKGVDASTAFLWAQPGAMVDVLYTLAQNPQIDWAVVSMGGNDLLDGYLLMGYGDSAFALIEQYLRTVIDQLVTFRPWIKISLNGYDFPNFEMSALCIVMGQVMLGGNTFTQNSLLAELTSIAQRIAQDYPQVYATDFLGTLQQVGGTANPPNFYRPSPAVFFPTDDCIHPSVGGWRHIMFRIYDEFFEPLIYPDDDDDDDNDDDDDDDSDDDDDDSVSDDDASTDDDDQAPTTDDDDDDDDDADAPIVSEPSKDDESDACGC